MKENTVTWKIFGFYMLIIVFMLCCNTAFSQINVKYFNAEWNKANSVEWCHTEKKGLKDCDVKYIELGLIEEK